MREVGPLGLRERARLNRGRMSHRIGSRRHGPTELACRGHPWWIPLHTGSKKGGGDKTS